MNTDNIEIKQGHKFQYMVFGRLAILFIFMILISIYNEQSMLALYIYMFTIPVTFISLGKYPKTLITIKKEGVFDHIGGEFIPWQKINSIEASWKLFYPNYVIIHLTESTLRQKTNTLPRLVNSISSLILGSSVFLSTKYMDIDKDALVNLLNRKKEEYYKSYI